MYKGKSAHLHVTTLCQARAGHGALSVTSVQLAPSRLDQMSFL
jgi:hypothetical protein